MGFEQVPGKFGSKFGGTKANASEAEQGIPPPSMADYSKGPSALDKAANLFFFTEIIRGKVFRIHPVYELFFLSSESRHVDRARTVLQTALRASSRLEVSELNFG